MSELTQCNYCRLQETRARAKAKRMEVTLLDDLGVMGGLNVYVHPATVKIRELSGGEDGERKQFSVGWFMELTDYCCC